MYENDNAAKISDNSMLPTSINTLSNNLSNQEMVIKEIESKLHRILNWKKESDAIHPTEQDKKVTESDFNSSFSNQMERFFKNNNRLDAILKHLSEII